MAFNELIKSRMVAFVILVALAAGAGRVSDQRFSAGLTRPDSPKGGARALPRLRGGSGAISIGARSDNAFLTRLRGGSGAATTEESAPTRLRGGSGAVSLSGASKMVRTCAFFASLDALLLGYDIGVVSGILVFIQDRFALSLIETGNFAAALNAAAIVGALASGWVADRFGRKPALFMSSLMFTSGSIFMASAGSYRALLFGRYIQGYGVGAGLLISPMFISEIAPPAFRGSLVTLSEVRLSCARCSRSRTNTTPWTYI